MRALSLNRKALQNRTTLNELKRSFLVSDAIPGYIILSGIGVLSCMWAGVQPVGFAVTHLFVLAALTVSLWRQPLQSNLSFRHPIIIICLVFLLLFALNMVIKKSPALGIDMFLMSIDLMIVLFVMYRMPQRALKPLFAGLCLLGSLLAILQISLIVFLKNDNAIPGILKHGGYHYGIFAILVAFPAVGAFFTSHRGGVRSLGLIASVLSFIYLLIDLKTIPIFLAFCGALIYIIRSRRHSGSSAYIVIILLLAALGLTGYHLSEWLFQDLYRSMKIEDPLAYHQFPMETALKAARDHWLTGVGAGNFPYISGIYKPPYIQGHIHRAHNSFLETFAEFGIVGMIAFVALLFSVLTTAFKLSQTRRLSRWIHRGFKVSIILMIPAALWDFGPQLPANLMLIALYLGFLIADTRKNHVIPGIQTGFSKTFFLLIALIGLVMPIMSAGVFYEIGRLHERNGRLFSARDCFQRAQKFNPFDDRYSAASGTLLVRIGAITGRESDFRAALHAMDRSLRRNPLQAPLYYAKAYVLSSLDPDDPENEIVRVNALKTAIDLDPFNHRFSTVLIQSLFIREDYAGAYAELDRIVPFLTPVTYRSFALDFVAIWPSPEMIENYLLERIDTLNPELTLAILQRLKQVGLDLIAGPLAVSASGFLETSEVNTTHLDYAKFLISLKEFETATITISKWISMTSDTDLRAQLLEANGDAYRSLGHDQDAIQMYESAIQIWPERVETHLKRITVLRKSSDKTTVIFELEKLVRRFENSIPVRLAMAREYQAQGLTLKALYEFRIANNLSGKRYSRQVTALEDTLDLSDIFRDAVEENW